MKKLKTVREADESSLSHTKWNCMYHIVLYQNIAGKVFIESCDEILAHTYDVYVIIINQDMKL